MRLQLKEPVRLNKPGIYQMLGLNSNRYVLFRLEWIECLEEVNDLSTVFNEIVFIIPGVPVLFPVPRQVAVKVFDKVHFPNLYMISHLTEAEINYLEYHSLATIEAVPARTDLGVKVRFNCTTNPAVARVIKRQKR